ncbi:MAG: hypothetical protein ACE5KI_03315 [Dehalococcoidia bacterium]
MLAVVAAMRRELAGIEGMLSQGHRTNLGGTTVFEGERDGQKVILAATGIGGKQAGEVMALVAERYRPQALLCIGYAGGISEELEAGDLVLYSRVHLLESPLPPDGQATPLDSKPCDGELSRLARQALERAEIVFREGDGVTVPHLISESGTKRWIGEHLNAVAIDMESYWVARAAELNQIPILGVRAITDPVDQRAPDMASVIDGTGDVSYWRALTHVLSHPFALYPMLRLARNAGRANRSLAKFVSAFISLTLA